MQTESQLKNLEKRKRFGKEQPPAKNGGRPRTVKMSEYWREWLQNPDNRKALTKRMLRLKPDVIIHYAEGKPIETQVQLSGELDETETEKAVARVLALRGVSEERAPSKDAP